MLTLRPLLRVAPPLLLQETLDARFFHQRLHPLFVPARACEAQVFHDVSPSLGQPMHTR